MSDEEHSSLPYTEEEMREITREAMARKATVPADEKGYGSVMSRIVEHGQTVHIGDEGRVIKFTRTQIPGGRATFELRNMGDEKVLYAIVAFTRAGYPDRWTFVDNLDAAREVADGKHAHQASFFWTSW